MIYHMNTYHNTPYFPSQCHYLNNPDLEKCSMIYMYYRTDLLKVAVTIGGTPCDVQSVSEKEILCITNRISKSTKTTVSLKVGGLGAAEVRILTNFILQHYQS